MSETNQPPAEAQPAASGDELTCGELSCEECNERYAKARAELESLRATYAAKERQCDVFHQAAQAFQERAFKAEQALSLAKGDTEAWNRSFHAERTQRQKAEQERDSLAAQVKDLKFREDRQTGSWNTLANCADTLRSRDFGTDLGAIDERVLAMAKALDAARTERDEWKAKAEKLAAELELARDALVNIDKHKGLLAGETSALAAITAALAEPKPADQGAT